MSYVVSGEMNYPQLEVTELCSARRKLCEVYFEEQFIPLQESIFGLGIIAHE